MNQRDRETENMTAINMVPGTVPAVTPWHGFYKFVAFGRDEHPKSQQWDKYVILVFGNNKGTSVSCPLKFLVSINSKNVQGIVTSNTGFHHGNQRVK